MPGQATKRQFAPPVPQNQVLMSMVELADMVQSQRYGGELPVSAMMVEYAQSQGRQLAVPSSGLSLRSPVAVKEDSVAARNMRAVKFSG